MEFLLNQLVDLYVFPELPEANTVSATFDCPHCPNKKYKRMKSLVNHIKAKHHRQESHPEKNTKKQEEDHILNYSKNALALCFIAQNFLDARKRGDGERIYRMYKYLLLYFKLDGRHKYSFQSLHFLAQINFLLPPALSHELKWNRFVNNLGKPDSNVELDRELEHRNKYVKADLHEYQGKITDQSIKRCSRSYDASQKIIANFDEVSYTNTPSGKHTVPDWKNDVVELAKQYTGANIFKFIDGRFHSSFPDYPKSYLMRTDVAKIKSWMYDKLDQFKNLNVYQHRNIDIR